MCASLTKAPEEVVDEAFLDAASRDPKAARPMLWPTDPTRSTVLPVTHMIAAAKSAAPSVTMRNVARLGRRDERSMLAS